MDDQTVSSAVSDAVPGAFWDAAKGIILAALDVVHAQEMINLVIETDADSQKLSGLLLLRKQRIHTLDLALKQLGKTGTGMAQNAER